jgi:hypothetical protein
MNFSTDLVWNLFLYIFWITNVAWDLHQKTLCWPHQKQKESYIYEEELY